MRGGIRWRPVLAALVVAVLAGCGLSPPRVDDREVRTLESWLSDQPQVSSVRTETGRTLRAGLGGEAEWGHTHAVISEDTPPEELLDLGERLRERPRPETISGVVEAHVDGLSLWLGARPEFDARSVALLGLVQEALGDIRAEPISDYHADDLPPVPVITDAIRLQVPAADLDEAAERLRSVVPPDGTEVEVDLRTAGWPTGGRDGRRTLVIGGDEPAS